MMKRNILKEVMIILGVSIITAFTVNYFSPNGIALIGQWDPSIGVVDAKSKEFQDNFIPEITDVTAAKKLFDSGSMLFVDARNQDAYEQGHIQGAVSFPVGRFAEEIDPFKNTYPTSTSIITYCSGRECNDSHKLAQLLFMEEYTEVKIFIDGYPAWEHEGYPRQ